MCPQISPFPQSLSSRPHSSLSLCFPPTGNAIQRLLPTTFTEGNSPFSSCPLILFALQVNTTQTLWALCFTSVGLAHHLSCSRRLSHSLLVHVQALMGQVTKNQFPKEFPDPNIFRIRNCHQPGNTCVRMQGVWGAQADVLKRLLSSQHVFELNPPYWVRMESFST